MNRAAAQAKGMTTGDAALATGILQRKCACGSRTMAGGECEGCKKKRTELRRSAVDPRTAPAEIPSIVHEVLRSPGQPLDASTRALMEPRFGHDFSGVRLHTDAKAAESTRAVNALAYTVGREVVFDAGQYRPETPDGRRLVADELAHTIQQNAAIRSSREALQLSGAGDPSEREAHAAADAVMRGDSPAPAHGFPAQITRQASPGAPPSPPRTQQQSGSVTSGDANYPCRFNRCSPGQQGKVSGDIGRAIGYVDAAIKALNAFPLAANTTRALDWYFNDSSKTTINEVQRGLRYIGSCLADAQNNNRYGCHLDYPGAAAYACMRTHNCNPIETAMCLTSSYFAQGDHRQRAEMVIHECAHIGGMSLGTPASGPDIYEFTSRFRYMDTSESLRKFQFLRFVRRGNFRRNRSYDSTKYQRRRRDCRRVAGRRHLACAALSWC